MVSASSLLIVAKVRLCVWLLCIRPYICSGSYCWGDSCIGHKPARLVCWDMRARVFSPVILNPMSHIVSPMCLDQLSSITLCNQFYESRIAGVTSQDFNTPLYGPWTVFFVKVFWSDSTMVCSRVVLGRVVGQIVFTWFLEDIELSLDSSVFEPIEAHVDGFGTFLFNSSCEDTTGSKIVGFQWSWWLWVV